MSNTAGIKAVIFDLDGTLIDTEKYYMKAWPEAMANFGYTMTYEDALTLRSLGRPFAPMRLQEISGDPNLDYQAVRECRKELMERYLNENGIELKPYALEVLQKLKDEDIIIALCTANDYERTERYLKRIGIFEYFDHIICASMVEKGKPAPDIYEFAIDELGLYADECIVVEDSPNGITSAATAGVRTVMIPDLTEPDDELSLLISDKYSNLKEFYEDIFG